LKSLKLQLLSQLLANFVFMFNFDKLTMSLLHGFVGWLREWHCCMQ